MKFRIGILLGVAAGYLAFAPEGKKLKDRLVERAKQTFERERYPANVFNAFPAGFGDETVEDHAYSFTA